MEALRGTLQGMRGTVSRLGSKASGISSVLNTGEGKITTSLESDGQFKVTVESFDGEKGDIEFLGNVDDGTTITTKRR